MGETLTLAEWSRRTGISPRTLKDRIDAGVPVDRALDPKPIPKVVQADLFQRPVGPLWWREPTANPQEVDDPPRAMRINPKWVLI